MKNLIFVLILFFIGYVPVYLSVTAPLRRFIGPSFVICLCLVTAVEFLSPSNIIFFSLLIAIFVLSVRDRMDAMCRYVLLTALVSTVSWTVRIGPAYITDFFPQYALGVALVIALMVKPGGNRADAPRGFTVEDGAILIVFLILWLGVGRFPSVSGFLRNLVTQGLLIGFPFYLIRRNIRTTEEFGHLIAVFGISSILLAVIAVYEARSGWAMFDYVSMHLNTVSGMSKNAGVRGGMLRATVTMLTPLNLACYLSLGLMALACTRRYYTGLAAYLGMVALVLLGFLAPQSRGNLICLVLGAIVLCIMYRKWAYLGATFVITAGSGALILAAAKVSPRVAAFLNLDSQPVAGGYYDYRQLLLHRGMEEGLRHPWVGRGLSDVLDGLADIQQGEHIVDLVNTYLTFFLTSGLLGTVPFIGCILLSLHKLVSGFPRRLDPNVAMVRAFCASGLCVMAMELAFMSFIDRIPYMLAFVLAGARLAGAEKPGTWRRPRVARNDATQTPGLPASEARATPLRIAPT